MPSYKGFSSIFGNHTIISLLKRDILVDASGKVLLFYGEVGTGKSSTALIYAVSYCCESPSENGDACCNCSSCRRNLRALKEKRDSTQIKTVNMGLYKKASDVNDLISTVFNMQSADKQIYILEEFHLLPKDFQANFLREIDNMQDGIKIIITSSSIRDINDAIASRSNKFLFSRLDKQEARRLVWHKFPYIRLSNEVLDYLIETSNYIPRDILVNLEFLIKSRASESEAQEYLQYISVDSFIDLLEVVLNGNVSAQRSLLNDLKAKVSNKSLKHSLKSFIINSIYLVSGCNDLPFTPEQEKKITSLFVYTTLIKFLKIIEESEDYSIDSLFFKFSWSLSPSTLGKVVSSVKERAKSDYIANSLMAPNVDNVESNVFKPLSKASFK